MTRGILPQASAPPVSSLVKWEGFLLGLDLSQYRITRHPDSFQNFAPVARFSESQSLSSS